MRLVVTRIGNGSISLDQSGFMPFMSPARGKPPLPSKSEPRVKVYLLLSIGHHLRKCQFIAIPLYKHTIGTMRFYKPPYACRGILGVKLHRKANPAKLRTSHTR